MAKPLVSVITPCFNGEKFVDRYFQSILEQTYDNIELIFINDGSEDKTEEIALSYSEKLKDKGVKFIYEYQKNEGQAAALNRGLKLFTGEYLTWPDSDDEMTEDCIEKKVKYMQEHTDVDLVVCKVACVNEADTSEVIEVMERKKPVGKETFFEDMLFLKNVFFTPGGYMVKGDAIDKNIVSREIYSGPGGQNAQILLPVAWKGKLGYIEEILYKYYIRKESHSHSIQTTEAIIQQLEFWEKILVETLNRMKDKDVQKYIPMIQSHYVTQRFGNAIDSKKADMINKYYKQMKKLKRVSVKERLLYLKYTNYLLRKLLKVDS